MINYTFDFNVKLIIAMYRLNLSKTLYRSFYLDNRIKPIILAHNNPFAYYAYLGINLSAINSQFLQTAQHIQSPLLDSFITQLNLNRYMIKTIQKQNYGFQEMHAIQNQEKVSVDLLNNNVAEIKRLKNHFKQLSDQILLIANDKNLLWLMQICLKLQIIEYTVWSKLFQICINTFQKLSPLQQSTIISHSHSYIKGRYISFTHTPSKYCYRENYLVDLTNFRQLIKVFITNITKDTEIQNQQPSTKYQNLQKINNILEKVSKIYVFNFTQLIQIYFKNASSFQRLIKQGHMEGLAEILRLFSIIGLSDVQQFKQIEQAFKKGWIANQNALSEQIKYKLISRILAFWANASYYNKQIYCEIIKPFIVKELESEQKRREHSIWLYNITASNIQDLQFQQAFLTKLYNRFPMSNKYLHIVNHYISILTNSKGYCSFICSKNQKVSTIVQKHGKVYLNCMERVQTKPQKDAKILGFINQEGIQQNPPEQFWLDITRRAFENLNKKYKDEGNGIYFNFQFCVFQIDAMIFLNKMAIGVEIIGTHYSLKGKNSLLSDQKQGKKNLKMKILKSYGIQFVQINSTAAIQRNIASFTDHYNGTKYIQQKIEQIIQRKQ